MILRPSSPQREARRRRMAAARPSWFRLGIMLFALLVAAAVIMQLTLRDTYPARASAPGDVLVDIAASTETYRDPAGRFTLALPAGWRVQSGEQTAPWDAVMDDYGLVSLRVQVADVDYATLDKLRERLMDIEEQWQIRTSMENVIFKGRPAIRRTVRVSEYMLRLLDFVAGGREYHLQVAVPVEHYDPESALVDDLLNCLTPAAG